VMLMLKRAPVMTLIALCLASSAAMAAGLNPQVTFPLHYKPSSFEACTGISPVDCLTNRPVVEAQAGQPAAIFLLVMNYTNLAGVQTAFDFGGWTFTFGLWDCQGGQLSAVQPGMPGGATAGTITTAFNCVTSGALQVIGRMIFAAPTAGCISQVQSTYPFGIHALDCSQGTDQITEDARLGKVCVGAGGVDACDVVSAVEGATWGGIKAQYH
jgi:hypothetical protein